MTATVKPLGNALRLEVEGDPLPGTLTNLIRNPNGELGGWGWETPQAESTMTGVVGDDGQRWLRYGLSGATLTQLFQSEPLPVGPTQYVAASWRVGADPESNPALRYKVRFDWYDNADTLIASSALSGYFTSDDNVVHTYGPVQPGSGSPTRVRIVFAEVGRTSGTVTGNGMKLALREVTVAAANTSGALGTVRTNLVTNPSVETNTTGWVTGAANVGTLARAAAPAGAAGAWVLQLAATRDRNILVRPARISVVGGADYAWSIALRAVTTPRVARLIVYWVDAIGSDISSSTVVLGELTNVLTRYGAVFTAPPAAASADFAVVFDSLLVDDVMQLDAALVEQTTTIGAYFDGSTANSTGVTHAWTGTAHASTSTETVSVLRYIAPIRWLNLLGSTHDVTITRERFNVSTLSALIVDSELDPSQSDVVRPGRLVRAIAYDDALDRWRELFTGKLSSASVAYVLRDPDEGKRARITLDAVDGAQVLANSTSTEGVRYIDELPYVLEKVAPSVPWNCNGNGGGVAFATIVETNDSTSALDQLALTRDTALGYVWVDRMGVVQCWDRDRISTTPAVPLLDEDTYTDVTVGYDTDAVVNEVVVTDTVYDAIDETNTTTTFDPYRDADSIEAWGVHRAEYSTHGLGNDVAVGEHAATVLGANAAPVVRLSAMQLFVDLTDDWSAVVSPHAFLDLYDLVEVTCERAGFDATPARVVGITHSISGPESKWLMSVELTSPTTVEAVDGVAAFAAGDPVFPVELPSAPSGGPTTFTQGGGGGSGGGGGTPTGPAGGDLSGTYPNPDIAAGVIVAADVNAANKDGTAATPSMRTLGTGAQQAAAGNDARFTDARPPTGAAGGSLTGTYPNPTLAANSVGNTQLAADAVTTGKIQNGTILPADLDAALASSIANAAVDTLVVHKAGAETITGVKTFDVPFVQTYQGSAPATPPAGSAVGPYFAGDGLPYYKTPSGAVVPLAVGSSLGALHSNPGFEAVSGATPTSWQWIWNSAGATVATETTDVLFGSRSVTLTVPPASSNQNGQSDVFDVNPGDVVTVGVWAHGVGAGAGQFSFGIQTRNGGTPEFLDGATTIQGMADVPPAAWTQYSRTFTVPAGHTKCRMYIRLDGVGATSTSVRVDGTTSSKSSAPTTTLPPNSWPKEAVRVVATTSFNPLAAAPSTVDGVALAVGDRVLKACSNEASNGVYTVVTVGTGSSGVWARAADGTTSAQLAAAEVSVTSGTVNGGSKWATSFKATDTLGTTAQTWAALGVRKYQDPQTTGLITVATGNAGPKVLTGASRTVVARSAADEFYITLELDWSGAGGVIAGYRVLVDGVAQPDVTQNVSVGGRFMFCRTWKVTGLSPGSHTFTASISWVAGASLDIVGSAQPGSTSMLVEQVMNL